MSKIIRYELKRLIFNKIFFALLIVTLIYSYFKLSWDIVIGVAYSAPFSRWSYGAYLAGVLPLLLTALLFFITYLYSNHEKQVKQLTLATPADPVKYAAAKCLAIIIGYIIISLLVIATSLIFYAVLFKYYNFGAFIIPILLTLIPGLLFIMGAGLLLGSVKSNLLYVLIVLVIIISFVPLPPYADLYGGHLYSTYPLKLPVGPDGEPIFKLPLEFILNRIVFSVTGAVMILFGIKRYALHR